MPLCVSCPGPSLPLVCLGGVVRSRFPPTWLGAVRPPWGGSVAYALWGLHAAGVAGGRPLGGWPATVVRGVWRQALSLPRPPVLWSGQPGFRDPFFLGGVGAGVGTQHRPHSVRPCRRALLAVGVAEGRPLGGCLPPL